jgi:cytochrome oxidase Cu insertion factor (SCO1/SenC/PrrC family)
VASLYVMEANWPPPGRVQKMPKVEPSGQTPDFTLNDYRGNRVRLADFLDKKHVVLVFNRGSM